MKPCCYLVVLVSCLVSLLSMQAKEPVRGVNEISREVLIIDSGVDDIDGLISGVRPGVEVVVLRAKQDGLEQIKTVLEGFHDLDVIHLISHGMPGALILAEHEVTAQRWIDAGVSQAVNESLKENGVLKLYGCQVAAGSQGRIFYDLMSKSVHADLMASTDFTGASELGGNWMLEAGNQPSDTKLPFREGFHYRGLLPPTVTFQSPSGTIFTRPGGSSFTWTYDQGTTPSPSYTGSYPVTSIAYWNVTDPNFNWILSRGSIQYASSTAGPWTTMTVATPPGQSVVFYPTPGRVFRFVDSQPADTTNNNSVAVGWTLQGPPGNVSSGTTVYPDNPPTDVFPKTTDYWGTPSLSDAVTSLDITDTGASYTVLPGRFVIDSQSVPNLFSITADGMYKSSGTLPNFGEETTVTLRYYDHFQLDDAGTPIPGQGVARTVTMVRRENPAGFGNDLSANTFKTNTQSNPRVAGLSDGGFVVVWRSAGQDGETTSQGGIYGQKYTSAGVASGGEFAISPANNGKNETNPSVEGLSGGRFVVTYQQTNTDNDVIYRVVEANGTLGAETSVASTTTGAQTFPWVSKLPNGNFVIAWIGPNGSDTTGVWVRQFNGTTGAAVASSEFASNVTQDGTQSIPGVAGLSDNNYVVSWRDSAESGNIHCRVMGASGPVSGEILAAGGTGAQTNPRVAGLVGGGFVITYSETARTEGGITDVSGHGNIYARRYNNSGSAQGGEFIINGGVRDNQTTPTICALAGGGFIVGWTSATDPDDSNGIFARRFDATGTSVDSYDFQLNQRRVDNQTLPDLAPLLNDSFAVAWADSTLDGDSNFGVGARLFTAGPPVSPTVTTPTSASVTHESATLGGNVTSDGGASVTARGVVYALTATNADPEIGGLGVTNVTGTGTTGVFTVNATGLLASSGYSYKAYATNSEGTTYSPVGTFSTLAPPALVPTVTSPTKASVTITTATLGGDVTSDGGASVTERGVVYAPTATNSDPEIGGTGVVKVAGIGTMGVFTVGVSGLSSSTGYSYKAYATNIVGTSYSAVDTFTTLATPAEIAVSGKGSNIADGSTTPSAGNDTDFGSVPVQGVTLEKTYTINNLGETALTVGTASAGGDFTITQQPTSPVAGGGSTTLTVSFDPSAEGLRTATVSFTNSDSDESPFSFDIQGTGTGPQTFDLATNPLANTPYDDGETYILTIAAVPTVVSPTKTGVGNTSATLGGNVTVDGGAITERGVLVSSTDNTPTIEEVGSGVTKFTTTGTTGVFTVGTSGLISGTTYYYVAYATNGLGTGYTTVDSFTTTTGPVPPEPVPTSLGDVVSFGDAPGEDGSASVGEFGKLLRGGFIAENGFLVFPGTLEIGTGSPAVTADTDSGLWKVGSGNLFLLARSGTTVPDVAGAQFDTLPEVPGINDEGEVSFLGSLIIGTGGVTADNDTGMWSEIGGTGLSLLMREDDDVPGVAGAKVKAFASGLFATAHTGATTGEAVFSVTYKGASTKTALLRASVDGATTTITEIAREGEAAPGISANFTNLAGSYVDPGRMDAQGNFVFAALTTPGNKDGIWYQPVGGSVSNVVFKGDVAPGTSGATFSKIYRPSMGSNGVIAFRAAVANNTGDNIGNTRNDGIWRVDSANPASMTCILRRGDDSSVVSNLPGVSRVGNVWGGWLANSNRGAWKAWLDVNGNFTCAANDGDVHAIYTDLSGSMQLGVAVGDAAPGTTGATFSGFDLPVVGGNDQYVFLGTLEGGDTTSDNNQGVWKSAASGGALSLVIRKGDVISTTEGNKTVEKMDFPGSNQTDRRWEQPVMDSTGLTVINITFTDGSTSQIQAP